MCTIEAMDRISGNPYMPSKITQRRQGFTSLGRWVYLLFTSYAGPACHGLPRLISLIFSEPFGPTRSRYRVITEMQPIALVGELVYLRRGTAHLQPDRRQATCLNPPYARPPQ